VMMAAGLVMAALVAVSAYYWWRQRRQSIDLDLPKWLLKAWVAAIPMGYIATECGWIVREVGRQPWAVYGLLRTAQAASAIPASAVATSLGMFALVYSLLLASFLVFARRIIIAGPNIDEPSPAFMPPANPHQEKA
jgi:cytochrome d ubiquinol oxidase subunit I